MTHEMDPFEIRDRMRDQLRETPSLYLDACEKFGAEGLEPSRLALQRAEQHVADAEQVCVEIASALLSGGEAA